MKPLSDEPLQLQKKRCLQLFSTLLTPQGDHLQRHSWVDFSVDDDVCVSVEVSFLRFLQIRSLSSIVFIMCLYCLCICNFPVLSEVLHIIQLKFYEELLKEMEFWCPIQLGKCKLIIMFGTVPTYGPSNLKPTWFTMYLDPAQRGGSNSAKLKP